MLPDGSRRRSRLPRYAVSAGVLAALLATGTPAVAGSTSAPDDVAVTGTRAPDQGAETARPTTQAEARPRLAPLARPLGQVSDGALPDPGTVAREIADELDSDWLGPADRRAIIVRDALTGEVLAQRNASRLVTPASTTKILSAAAIVSSLPGEQRFATRVVAGESADEVVLVAGGDMLLARGEGDPGAVAGHAGVADLAARTAEALEGRALEGPVRVRLDLQHVAGPHKLDSWSDFWISEGYAGRIVQLGLAEDLALPFYPSPTQPEQEVARAFAAALDERGVEVAGWPGEDAAGSWTAELVETPAGRVGLTPPGSVPEGLSAPAAGADGRAVTAGPDGATSTGSPDDVEVLAEVWSAALRDVLAHALATSDNAMVEQLSRQAASVAGEGSDRESVTAWIRSTVQEAYGVDMEGQQLADSSGLSDGTRLTVQAVADVLVAGADGSHPDLQGVLAAGGLPIAGYTGTLSTRFHLPVHAAAIGNARAKTGSLPGVTSLAGTVVTADGRLLVFAMTADDIGADGAVLEARSSLDEVVAQLARCGC